MVGLAKAVVDGMTDKELGEFIHGSPEGYEQHKMAALAKKDAPIEDGMVGLADMITNLATPLAIPAKIAGKKGGKAVARKLNDLYMKAEPEHLTIKATKSGRYEGPFAELVDKMPSPREVQHAVNEQHLINKAMREYEKFINSTK